VEFGGADWWQITPLLLAKTGQSKIENVVNIMAEAKASTSHRFLILIKSDVFF